MKRLAAIGLLVSLLVFMWVPTAFSTSALTEAPGISTGTGAATPAYWWHPEVSWLEAQYPAVHWNDQLDKPIDLTTWMSWVRFVGHADLPVPKGVSRMALVESLAPLFEGAYFRVMDPAFSFADAPFPDDPRFPLIYEAYGTGVLRGYPDGTLRLSQQATRSEALALLARALRAWEPLPERLMAGLALEAFNGALLSPDTSVDPAILPAWKESLSQYVLTRGRTLDDGRFMIDPDLKGGPQVSYRPDRVTVKVVYGFWSDAKDVSWGLYEMTAERIRGDQWVITGFRLLDHGDHELLDNIPRFMLEGALEP